MGVAVEQIQGERVVPAVPAVDEVDRAVNAVLLHQPVQVRGRGVASQIRAAVLEVRNAVPAGRVLIHVVRAQVHARVDDHQAPWHQLVEAA